MRGLPLAASSPIEYQLIAVPAAFCYAADTALSAPMKRPLKSLKRLSAPASKIRSVRGSIAALALVCVAALGSEPKAESGPLSASVPIPRTDRNSLIAHEQLVRKAKQGRIDIYFVGDSITRRWGAADPQYRQLLDNWTTNFFGWNAANFGWGADRVENILWRLQHDELDGVSPKVIVVLAGINNVGAESGTPEKEADITDGLKALLGTCKAKAPNATIILTGIFPRNDNMAVIPTIDRINANLSGLADGKRVRYININNRLADTNGRFFAGMVNPDRLHPTVQAYQVWADELKPIFAELLGPPAKIDQAPPPTADPHAAP